MYLEVVLSDSEYIQKILLESVSRTQKAFSIKPLGFKIVTLSLEVISDLVSRVHQLLIGFNAKSTCNELENWESFDRVLVHDVKLVDEWILGLFPSFDLALGVFGQDLLVTHLVFEVCKRAGRIIEHLLSDEVADFV